MAEFTWEHDVQDNVLKNHSLSSQIREAAIPATRFVPYCYPEPGYGKGKGDSHTVTLIKNLVEPASAELGERDRISIDTFAQTSVTFTIKELGRGVEYTHKSQLLSHFDREDRMQRKLRQQLSLVLDTAASVPFKSAKIKFIPTTLSGGVFDTDGVPSTQALVNGTVSHIQVIRDYLADTIHCPPYMGEYFVCLASTKFLRGLKNDPLWVEYTKYGKADDEGFRMGRVGKIENIEFVEVNHTQALANNKGAAGVLGEAVIFGEDAVAMITAEDPELRAAMAADFGRQKAVAWYGVITFGLLWATANDGEARVIHVTSS